MRTTLILSLAILFSPIYFAAIVFRLGYHACCMAFIHADNVLNRLFELSDEEKVG